MQWRVMNSYLGLMSFCSTFCNLQRRWSVPLKIHAWIRLPMAHLITIGNMQDDWMETLVRKTDQGKNCDAKLGLYIGTWIQTWEND